jgi:hypothetical protein
LKKLVNIDDLEKPHPNTRLSLFIVGKHEVIGLEEIIQQSKKRRLSVTVSSSTATLYFMNTENFIDCVNQYKFSKAVLEEELLRHSRYLLRVNQTKNLLDKHETD